MLHSLSSFLKWVGYVLAAVLLLVIGGVVLAFSSVIISIVIAVGTVSLLAYVISEWNSDE